MAYKHIKVKAIESFEVYNHNRTLSSKVDEWERFTATLDEESGEYFAQDFEGREVYVGCIDADGNLVLDESFVLTD